MNKFGIRSVLFSPED